MSDRKERGCETCRHVHRGYDNAMQCRRFPPVPVAIVDGGSMLGSGSVETRVRSEFPAVDTYCWCGEYGEKEGGR